MTNKEKRNRNIAICALIIVILLVIFKISACNGNSDSQENDEALIEQETVEESESSTVDDYTIVIPKEDDSETKIEPQKKDTSEYIEITKNEQQSSDDSKNTISKNDSNESQVVESQVQAEKVVDVTIQIASKSSLYGYPMEALDFTIVEGNASKEQLENDIVLTKQDGQNAGTYEITGVCTNTNNWNVTFVNGTYTVIPRNLVIKIDSKQSYQNEKLVELTYSIVSGTCADGEKLENIVQVTTLADPKKVGEYEIVGINCNSNYNVIFTNGIYKVIAKSSTDESNNTNSSNTDSNNTDSNNTDSNDTDSNDMESDSTNSNVPSNSTSNDEPPAMKDPGEGSGDEDSKNNNNEVENIVPAKTEPKDPDDDNTANNTDHGDDEFENVIKDNSNQNEQQPETNPDDGDDNNNGNNGNNGDNGNNGGNGDNGNDGDDEELVLVNQ